MLNHPFNSEMKTRGGLITLCLTVLLRSPLELSELVKRELFEPKTLPHCGVFWGVNDLPLPCVCDQELRLASALFFSFLFFNCTSGIMLRFPNGTGRRVNFTL